MNAAFSFLINYYKVREALFLQKDVTVHSMVIDWSAAEHLNNSKCLMTLAVSERVWKAAARSETIKGIKTTHQSTTFKVSGGKFFGGLTAVPLKKATEWEHQRQFLQGMD